MKKDARRYSCERRPSVPVVWPISPSAIRFRCHPEAAPKNPCLGCGFLAPARNDRRLLRLFPIVLRLRPLRLEVRPPLVLNSEDDDASVLDYAAEASIPAAADLFTVFFQD